MKNLIPSLSRFTLFLPMETPSKKHKCFLPLAASLLLSTFLIISSLFSSSLSHFSSPNIKQPLFVESKLQVSPPSSNPIPRLAYLISGSVGDGENIKRTLRALYHPLNQYVLHLDLESLAAERLELAEFVRNDPVFTELGNVRVVVRANLVTYRGPTMVTNTLHAAAILLKQGGDWDWFINLSASDYPLITQDDLLHTLSSIPRDLNFIEHTSDIGWKEFQRAKPVIIDPGLYSSQKSDVFWVTEKRSVPTAFKLFTGSAWMMLSRPFMEFCVWGWDNLPRTVLMYYANFLSSPEGYFHTVICNTNEFHNTTVNHDLHFISWDNPPKQHPHFLTIDNFQKMVDSNAPFARKFNGSDPVLDKIDKVLLGRATGGFVPGGWFNGRNPNVNDPHSAVGNATALRPGPGAERFRVLLDGLISGNDFHEKHCI
ncbi:beta-glucuronosyltransferase GlcAT14B-like [Tasmannia lanceolata]|uniref:beta-glucuronosyltransferase GlcAT14B-like n=1 Tax=Tasmannia lanceolata TaxID=3420 RepID=UPI0040647C43